ncbi:MAG: metalloregulator ArsR/SmtB family transcription factor [Oscillospiraceae bacterium]|nr:metalloregulator ArsR/SmtB family transcription factor [Oscillospiraceae bacterium]
MDFDRINENPEGTRGNTLRQQLSLGGDFAAVAELFRLLDDSSRVRIFWLLCHCEGCVIELAEMTGMSSPALSHHLKLLREAGMITARREGKEVYYRASETPACRLLHNVIEKVMEISCPETETGNEKQVRASSEQIETVRRMHDELLQHPERRITIDELARQYLINPTTLKEVFKEVYGDSLAAHMKEHRMEKAAELLLRSDESISAVAGAVGYDSSSRFSAAFRERYHLLPKEYRRLYRKIM